MNNAQKITKHDNIAQLIEKYPQTAPILIEEYGMHCVGCMASAFETLEDGAQAHSMSKEQINKMIKRLNEAVNKNRKS